MEERGERCRRCKGDITEEVRMQCALCLSCRLVREVSGGHSGHGCRLFLVSNVQLALVSLCISSHRFQFDRIIPDSIVGSPRTCVTGEQKLKFQAYPVLGGQACVNRRCVLFSLHSLSHCFDSMRSENLSHATQTILITES